MKIILKIMIVTLFIFSTLVIPMAFGDEMIELDSGETIILKDDKTWDYVNEMKSETGTDSMKPVNAKYADDAVTVWDKALELGEVNYSKSVKLYLHYWNHTAKRVVGISTYVKITNPFGKVVFENTYHDETALGPLEKQRSDSFYHFDENPFIPNRPYNFMWQMAQNGTGKIEARILKVVFDDGSVLTARSSKPTSPKKKKK